LKWTPAREGRGRLVARWHRFLLSDRVRFVVHSLEDRGPVLDVGCGDGALLQALAENKVPCYGVDPALETLRRARNQGAEVACGAAPFFPFASRRFGAVTMFQILEHLRDPVSSVLAARELLAPGGRLVVQAPNAASWQFLLLGERWSCVNAPRHLTHFRLQDLEDLLSSLGFEVRQRKFFTLGDSPAALVSSLFPQLEPLARRVRGVRESWPTRLLKDCLYSALAVAAAPLCLLEAAGSSGSLVTLEAAVPRHG
jgi:SAM-dependent methyltransferase